MSDLFCKKMTASHAGGGGGHKVNLSIPND